MNGGFSSGCSCRKTLACDFLCTLIVTSSLYSHRICDIVLVASLNTVYSSSVLHFISNTRIDTPEKFSKVKDTTAPKFCQASDLYEFPINHNCDALID